MKAISYVIGRHLFIGKVLTLLTFAMLTEGFEFLLELANQWPLILAFPLSVISTSIIRGKQLNTRGTKRLLHYYNFSFSTIIFSWISFFVIAAILFYLHGILSEWSMDILLAAPDEHMLLSVGLVFLFYGVIHALTGGIILAFALQNSTSKPVSEHNNSHDS